MPELPEVETIRLGLQKYLVGHRIEKVDVRLPKIFQGDVKNIEGGKIISVRRFGKGLVIDLENKNSIAIHIKLTGQLIYRGPNLKQKVILSKKAGDSLPSSRTHVIFELDKGGFLYYNDLRQFGWIKIVKTDEVFDLPFFKRLGPELLPSSGQAPLTLQMFKKIIHSSKLSIKPFLMDQKKIGGIGNIYANDGLFDAEIDPRRRAGTLSEEEIKKLYSSLLKVLKAGFKYKGASELNFVNVLGEEGDYQKHFLVYSREGQKCKRSGRRSKSSARQDDHIIKKIKLGGRRTYYSQKCQK